MWAQTDGESLRDRESVRLLADYGVSLGEGDERGIIMNQASCNLRLRAVLMARRSAREAKLLVVPSQLKSERSGRHKFSFAVLYVSRRASQQRSLVATPQ